MGESRCVVVSVAEVKGSAPREPGAKMIVSGSRFFGTIGGGNLEFTAIHIARSMLGKPDGDPLQTLQFALGPSLEQCCGGRVVLAFEKIETVDVPWINAVMASYRDKEPCIVVTRFGLGKAKALVTPGVTDLPHWMSSELSVAATTLLKGNDSCAYLETASAETELVAYTLDKVIDNKRELWLFGAGHVGRAIVEVLAGLPYRIMWVDSRPDEFPESLPPDVSIVVAEEPEEKVAAAAPGALYLVMTHSHQLDEDICYVVLKREDFGYLGLIGSATKKSRFLHRIRDRGISEELLTRLTCPIGIPGIKGKMPREIAISVAAQLLSLTEHARDTAAWPS